MSRRRQLQAIDESRFRDAAATLQRPRIGRENAAALARMARSNRIQRAIL